MEESKESLQNELEMLRKRVKRLAVEKSHMQLISDLLSELAPVSGLQNIVERSLQFLMNSIGGTNIFIYYVINSQWHYMDVYGQEEVMMHPGDDLVNRAVITMKAQKRITEAGVAPLSIRLSQSGHHDLAFPLIVEGEIFGALGISGILLHLHDEIVDQLQFLANYISLVVRNETLNQSRLKIAYDELKRKNEQLKLEIAERIKAEAQAEKLAEELLQSRKMEAIGTMAGGIAHDFNNLLGAIMGFTELAHDSCDSEELRQYLDQVITASERAQDLVGQILTFSRKQDTDVAPLNPEPVVKEVMKLLRSTFPTSITIETHIQRDIGHIMGNVTQLHQILMNLCTNARYAMNEFSGTLQVQLKPEQLHGKPAVCLSVTDNGRGIPPELLDRIFEPYFTTKEVGKGTGMGLAVVHGITQSFGGTVTVQSVFGKGSTFSCFFPVVEGQARAETQKEKRLRFTGRALLVDDEPLIANMGAEMLRRLGFEVDAFNDGLKAWEYFSSDPQRYTLVVTDQTMPRLTGLQLAAKINKVSSVPVLLFSGFSEQITPQNIARSGVKAVGDKPYGMKRLSSLIEQVLPN